MAVRMLARAAGVLLLVGCAVAAAQNPPPHTETMAERTLFGIVDRQKSLLAQLEAANKSGEKLDQESFRTQLESLAHEYQLLLQQNPDFAAAYASYGYLLSKLDNPKQALEMLLKADRLDPSIPLVKNQLGNLLAEDGKPLEAANYFRDAMKLDPDEPMYPYQLGRVMTLARDTFLQEGGYARPQFDQEMQDAFRKAYDLAPKRLEYAYGYAMSFYSLAHPNWDEAFELWAKLAEQAPSLPERQTMILHEANVRIKQGRTDEARQLTDEVTLPELQKQRQKLIAQLAESAKN